MLCFGGSLGAKRINDAAVDYIEELVKEDKIQLMFGTGKRNYDEVMTEIKNRGINLENHKNIRVCDYIYDMDKALAAADVVIGRAGAISISEITALGKASILIPSPNVAHNHQYTNAKALADKGAAIMITEDELGADTLSKTLGVLLNDKDRIATLQQNTKKIGTKDASKKIYELACSVVRK